MIGKILLFNDRDFSRNGFSKPRRRAIVIDQKGNRLLLAITRGLGVGAEINKRLIDEKRKNLLRVKDNLGTEFYVTNEIVDSYFVPIQTNSKKYKDSNRSISDDTLSKLNNFIFHNNKKLSIGSTNTLKRKNFKNYK